MARTDRYHGPDDLPRQVPLFPLRGAILLPRATLPLNVFEPRYLQMVDDVLSGKRLIGIIQPDEPVEPANTIIESPKGNDSPLKTIGCAGRITGFQELEDGRVMVTLTGIARFRLVNEQISGRPYRTAEVDWSEFSGDFSAGLGEENVDRKALLRVLRRYLDAKRLEAEWPIIEKSSSEFLVNALAVMSPYGAEEKQALLEAPSLKARAEVLVALAEMEMAAGSTGGSMIQ
ncbi:MAG: LON peptidase substrate-binding domain-containing protein [Hyphomicrobiaceae bacterium]|nr:LON peptidase substrate-binding domain-containing protein [Hyphomicrobiaceae bacterium]MCC0009213.1 LON peptidase substrate-binding domain-containing protein [Hyphomicrobiaceae bacterium]